MSSIPRSPIVAATSLPEAAAEAAALLRSLANPERLVLMCALVEGERCVSELALATGIAQPTLSQQLGVLRDDGLVATRREGRFVFYRVASDDALALLATLHGRFCGPAARARPRRRPESPARPDRPRLPAREKLHP